METIRWVLVGWWIVGAVPALAAAQADGLDAPPAEADTDTQTRVAAPPLDTTPPAAGFVASPSTLVPPSGYTVAVDPDLAQWGINDTPRVPAVPLVVDQERSRIPRITLLTLVAGVTMVGSGFGMFELGCAFSGGRISVSCYAVGYSLAAVSALSLTPLSVWLTGKLTDGNGSYGWTLLGTAIGMAAGAAGALAVFASNAPGDTALIPLMIGPLLGSVFLYELSSDASREAVAEAEQSVRFGASVAPTDEGGMVNVVGTF